jgi:hypothetical protein
VDESKRAGKSSQKRTKKTKRGPRLLRILKLLGDCGHLDEEKTADDVVAAFVGVFEVFVIPIVRIF